MTLEQTLQNEINESKKWLERLIDSNYLQTRFCKKNRVGKLGCREYERS